MDANGLIERIKHLQEAVDQSAANHNGLVGRLLEARELLESMAKPAEEAAVADDAEVIEAVAE